MEGRSDRLRAAQTLYHSFIRWSLMGVFDRIFAGFAGEGPKPERTMIDATHLKAHRTAASLLKRGMFPVVLGEPRAGWTRSSIQSAPVTDGRSSCSRRKARCATTRAPAWCSAPCREPLISSPPAATTAHGSPRNWKPGASSRPSGPAEAAKSRRTMTRRSTDTATRSRTCLQSSSTGGASPPATTDAPKPSSRPSASHPPSSSGSDQ
jgi:hypothetical protein